MTETRPLLSAPLPWQQTAWELLLGQLEQGRLPHGIVLQGVVDSGVEDFALLLAQHLLCDLPQQNLPCGQCRSCHLYKAGSHPDFECLTLEPTEKGDKLSRFIKIDQVRAVLDTVQQTSMRSARKVLVIYPAEAMNAAAANALLKSLEEPPAGTVFLLAANNTARLMATIRSRCQSVTLPLPTLAESEDWLRAFMVDRDKSQQLLAMAGHNPLLVKKWIDEEVSSQVLAISAELEQLQQGRLSPLQLAAQWQKAGVYNRLLWWWRWLALQIRREEKNRAVLAQYLSFMDKLLTSKRLLESAANPSEALMLESLLIDWHNLHT